MFHFCNPWRYQKPKQFLTSSGGIENWGQNTLITPFHFNGTSLWESGHECTDTGFIAPFLYPLKTSQNIWFSDVFRGYKKGYWRDLGWFFIIFVFLSIIFGFNFIHHKALTFIYTNLQYLLMGSNELPLHLCEDIYSAREMIDISC